eukprot:symbB.v1.2.011018.t1/scaffold726.1/size168711/4
MLYGKLPQPSQQPDEPGRDGRVPKPGSRERLEDVVHQTFHLNGLPGLPRHVACSSPHMPNMSDSPVANRPPASRQRWIEEMEEMHLRDLEEEEMLQQKMQKPQSQRSTTASNLSKCSTRASEGGTSRTSGFQVI